MILFFNYQSFKVQAISSSSSSSSSSSTWALSLTWVSSLLSAAWLAQLTISVLGDSSEKKNIKGELIEISKEKSVIVEANARNLQFQLLIQYQRISNAIIAGQTFYVVSRCMVYFPRNF